MKEGTMKEAGGGSFRVSIIGYPEKNRYFVTMNKTFPLIMLAVISLAAIQSCVKDTVQNVQPVEAGFYQKGLQSKFIRISSAPTEISVSATVLQSSVKSGTLSVKFEKDPTLIAALNTSGNITYQALPDSCYSITKPEQTIQTGDQSVSIPVTIYTSKIDPFTKYVLPLKLTSSNMLVDPQHHTVLLRIMLANDYSGTYTDTVSCNVLNPNPYYNTSFTDSVITKDLTAVDDSTVLMDAGVPGMLPPSTIMTVYGGQQVKAAWYQPSVQFSINYYLLANNGTYTAPSLYFRTQYAFVPSVVLTERLRKL
jgi:hypothetical protein